MTAMNRCRSYWHITDAIGYTVMHSSITYLNCIRPLECSRFLHVDVEDDMLLFDSLSCKGGDIAESLRYPLQEEPLNSELREDNYYQFQRTKFDTGLRTQYPDISSADAVKLTDTFMEILQIANASHRCPQCTPGAKLATCHNVTISKLEPHPNLRKQDPDTIGIWGGSGDHNKDVLELPWPTGRPATTASIMELFKSSSSRGDDCAICLEEMDTRPKKRLTMPCSHSFHGACLIKWLNNDHFCPVCRYEMPAAVLYY